ncbi:unnamed protein product, partial [Adineta ricciae]
MITTIEHFSNEIFHEIFEYLYGNEIYKAFSRLNYRFEQLIDDPCLQYKILIDYSSNEKRTKKKLKRVCQMNKKQIFCISIWTWINNTEIISSLDFNSSYSNLQHLILSYIQPNTISVVLHQLIELPRLYSLTIQTEDTIKTFGKIYQLVFTLPKLRYFKCKADEATNEIINKSLPIASLEQLTSIEQLIIDHPCSLKQLVHLVSYTPKLQYLKFLNLNDNNKKNFNFLSSIQLPNLTFLSIQSYHTMFDTLETCIDQFTFDLKIFSINIHAEDRNYLDAQRWKQIIQRNFSKL